MSIFSFAGKELSFLQALEAAANTVPTIGDPSPDEIIGLAHYSKDPNISSFRSSSKYQWTHRVCDTQDCISAITQLGEIRFKAVYVIRLAIGSSYTKRCSDVGVTKEYALGIPVPNGSFSKLLLEFNETTRSYSVV